MSSVRDEKSQSFSMGNVNWSIFKIQPLGFLAWLALLVIWIVFVSTGGRGVSAELTVVFFAVIALSLPTVQAQS